MAHKIICINRRCGSGGHIIGEMVANQLGIKYYDKNLLTLALEYGGLDGSKNYEKVDEKATSTAFYRLQYEGNEKVEKGRPANETLFQLQRDLMREIAQKEDCVIIGRCGDYILEREDVDLFSVFVTASLEHRIRHIMEQDHLSQRQAAIQTRKIDKRRENYYYHFTKREWKDAKHYDILLNSQRMGYDKCTRLICDYYHTIL
jgi:cytidylate kinase